MYVYGVACVSDAVLIDYTGLLLVTFGGGLLCVCTCGVMCVLINTLACCWCIFVFCVLKYGSCTWLVACCVHVFYEGNVLFFAFILFCRVKIVVQRCADVAIAIDS